MFAVAAHASKLSPHIPNWKMMLYGATAGRNQSDANPVNWAVSGVEQAARDAPERMWDAGLGVHCALRDNEHQK